MKTIQLDFPDSFDLQENDVKWILATSLYEKGKLSTGQCAELLGVSRRTFIEMMGQYGVSLFQIDADELQREIDNA